MGGSDLAALGAAEAARRIREGAISSKELVRACLDRIAARDSDIHAFAFVDANAALEQARQADTRRAQGKKLGLLHGVPIALKDVIETKEMPTEYGSALFAGHIPSRDAHIVSLLRKAGAIVLGKTATTEFALFHPAATRNPRAPGRTPGGSSSGSAAAVADHMVPASIGTQTAGSVIRPASFCGVVGFKPTYGSISRSGVLPQSPELDTIGLFARSVDDVALLADALTGFDPADAAMSPKAASRMSNAATAEPPAAPRFAFIRTSAWPEAGEETRKTIAGVGAMLGPSCDEIVLPETFDHAIRFARTIQMAGVAAFLGPYQSRDPSAISAALSECIEEGRRISATEYIRAVAARPVLAAALDEVLSDYDAILTPAVTGHAPEGLSSTGSPVFCAAWTWLRVPAITLPVAGPNDPPLGIQLVGRMHRDGELLRTARWLEDALANADKTRASP